MRLFGLGHAITASSLTLLALALLKLAMHLKRVRDPPHTPHGCVPQAALSLGNECSQEGEGSLPKPPYGQRR